jgi:hypothetical protein
MDDDVAPSFAAEWGSSYGYLFLGLVLACAVFALILVLARSIWYSHR